MRNQFNNPQISARDKYALLENWTAQYHAKLRDGLLSDNEMKEAKEYFTEMVRKNKVIIENRKKEVIIART